MGRNQTQAALRHTIRGLVLAALAVRLALSQTPAAPQQQQQQQQKPLPPVTTTIEVHAEIKETYRPDAVTVGTLNGAPLRETPVSALVVTQQLLADQDARLLSDVVKNDASIGEDYAPVGYYGDYEIRGFPIDLATGLEINGMTIAGEQDVPLENKERVEFLKGIAGVESGVTTAGGLINFVTKRPSPIKAMDLATDHRGSAFGDTDLGWLFGSGKQVGTRFNLAGERIASYVNGANGWRGMGAGAADWHIAPLMSLKSDFEYQHKVERSVCGYQLLGGDVVPDIDKISPSTMLGFQPWAPPNTFDTYNTSVRLDRDLPRNWQAFGQASFSHSLIDDNVIYAYGNSETAPSYFFAPDGTYDIYDYRDPGELRIDAQAEALVAGKIRTGPITQDLAFGGEIFRRSVQQPGYFTQDNPYSPDGIIQAGAVYTWIGSENIYQPDQPFPMESPVQQAGPRRLWEDNHQSALVMQDRLHLPGRIDLLAGGRLDSLRDNNYSLTSGCTDFGLDPNPCVPVPTRKLLWLPTYAITFTPVSSLMLYSNYSVMLSLGPQGPWWVDNANDYLAPYFTRQAEIGAKYEPNQRILLTTALFHMRAPFFYPKIIQAPDSFCSYNFVDGSPVAPGDLCFESEGRETHNGIELNAQGRATHWLQLTASAAAMNATSNNTGTPSYDNKQVINAPRVRTAVFADMLIPHARNLHLMPGWSYTARKEATRDDAVSVPGYNLFNLGARYMPRGEDGHVTLRLYADNITDKRYWKDTGASYGDTFIHLGAPTTVRLSAHYTF
ncbi:TonB-dependent siderophore receptor [Terracidiphilus sp.]|jgi:iron complex outermembrane receptor protein|uniref:TonB-dependent siderophore receptor n=1 Tax=Terracidiphilus sp. TaxID=1964191 RepID=UPI003C292C45